MIIQTHTHTPTHNTYEPTLPTIRHCCRKRLVLQQSRGFAFRSWLNRRSFHSAAKSCFDELQVKCYHITHATVATGEFPTLQNILTRGLLTPKCQVFGLKTSDVLTENDSLPKRDKIVIYDQKLVFFSDIFFANFKSVIKKTFL